MLTLKISLYKLGEVGIHLLIKYYDYFIHGSILVITFTCYILSLGNFTAKSFYDKTRLQGAIC